MSRPQGDDALAPRERLLRLLGGKWVVAALAAAANIGLPDALAAGPKTLAALAQELGCHPPSLERLLRVLVGEEIVADAPAGFTLTDQGRHLRSDSLGPLVRYVGSMPQWAPWANLDHSVRTGEAAFEKTHGVDLYTYLSTHPEHAAIYDAGVDRFTQEQARKLAEDEAFEETRWVVDVGGGRGSVLVALLERWTHLRGTLFDLPHVVTAPDSRLGEGGDLFERCELRPGDMQQDVPEGADCYVIKHVLHNWDDDTCVRLLSRCERAMAPGGRVLVVEGIVLAGNFRDRTRLLDLEMLVSTDGGRERRKPEFRRLMRDAGLRLHRALRLTDGAWCLEAVPLRPA